MKQILFFILFCHSTRLKSQIDTNLLSLNIENSINVEFQKRDTLGVNIWRFSIYKLIKGNRYLIDSIELHYTHLNAYGYNKIRRLLFISIYVGQAGDLKIDLLYKINKEGVFKLRKACCRYIEYAKSKKGKECYNKKYFNKLYGLNLTLTELFKLRSMDISTLP